MPTCRPTGIPALVGSQRHLLVVALSLDDGLINADLPTRRPALLPAHLHANTFQYGILGRLRGRQACVYPAGLLSMPDMEYLFCCKGLGGLPPPPPPQASCYDRATTRRRRRTPANILVLTCRSADLPTHPIIILYNVYVGPY